MIDDFYHHPFWHAISLATIFGWFAGLLPAIATALAILWYLIQIHESATCVKAWKRVTAWKEARWPSIGK